MSQSTETAIAKIREKTPRMAICYDFDKTLSPDDMQTFTLIPSLSMDTNEFWAESNQLAVDNLMDKNLAWMYQMIVKSKASRRRISRDYFHDIGKDIKLYKGVPAWFKRINDFGSKQGIEVQHYIISSGLKELVEGSTIAPEFKRIYASSFLYSPDGVAEWPAQAVNYTNKTQFIFRIAKGKFEECDEGVNDSMTDDELYIPYENIIYIGDSATDIPCMRLVKSKGGYSIGVYDPDKDDRAKVYSLLNDGRIDYFASADYTAKGTLNDIVFNIINNIATKEKLRTEAEVLRARSRPYILYKSFQAMMEQKPKIMKRDQELLMQLKKEVEGNIESM
ncbi:HAD family hydrolase [Acetonema longum]|uniref:Haloacid dehalogenase-like hydrolase n=1 Tax=Acetonema longum DSM 6540 TaxID=1009370 RepID=F7NFC9_9FIRM|nr:HAD family hydrolase [Acetonema longum]EGO65254.1 hypothetical protein ALO_03781 [Acetonema longum DSM 6540]